MKITSMQESAKVTCIYCTRLIPQQYPQNLQVKLRICEICTQNALKSGNMRFQSALTQAYPQPINNNTESSQSLIKPQKSLNNLLQMGNQKILMPQVGKKSLVKAKSKRLDKYISCNDLEVANGNLNFVKKVDNEFRSNENNLNFNSTKNLEVQPNYKQDPNVFQQYNGNDSDSQQSSHEEKFRKTVDFGKIKLKQNNEPLMPNQSLNNSKLFDINAQIDKINNLDQQLPNFKHISSPRQRELLRPQTSNQKEKLNEFYKYFVRQPKKNTNQTLQDS